MLLIIKTFLILCAARKGGRLSHSPRQGVSTVFNRGGRHRRKGGAGMEVRGIMNTADQKE